VPAVSVNDIVRLTLTTVSFPNFHPLAGQMGVVNAFAIRHPYGVVLVDTGIGEGSAFVDRAYRPQRRDLANELRKRGLEIGDVVTVVNGHLHMDNVGGNALFPGVPIVVQEAEWEAAHAGGETYREDRVDFDVCQWIDFAGATYQIVNGECEILPGIRVVPTPGHTTGHQAVVIDTDAGPAIVAGQVPYDAAEWSWIRAERSLVDGPAGSAANIVVGDAETYLASVRGLVELAPRCMHFTHDPHAWRDDDLP
jgi:N-acyl homoserine lactone hydrolase